MQCTVNFKLVNDTISKFLYNLHLKRPMILNGLSYIPPEHFHQTKGKKGGLFRHLSFEAKLSLLLFKAALWTGSKYEL